MKNHYNEITINKLDTERSVKRIVLSQDINSELKKKHLDKIK